MVIAIDIGNSTIGFGFLDKGCVERVVRVENMPDSALAAAKLDNFLDFVRGQQAITAAVLCSVVPEVAKTIERKIKRAWKVNPRVIGRDIKIPIVNKYRSQAQVGHDRLVCAFAARELYGAPAVVIDVGTAVTFDAVSPRGAYLGGAILPGIRLSAEALFEKTALLPMARLVEPKSVIGRSTQEGIQSGIFHGYGALCDGMAARLGEEMGCMPRVIVTGGYAGAVRRFMQREAILDEELIFKGMSLV